MANIYIFLYSLSIGIADTYISYNKTRKSLSIDSTAKKNLDGKLMVSHFKLTDRPLKLKRTLDKKREFTPLVKFYFLVLQCLIGIFRRTEFSV